MFHWLPRWMDCNHDQRRGLLAFACFGILIALAALTDDAGRAIFALRGDKVFEGELWRILTGHIVHLSRMHAFMNELGLLFLIVVLWDVLEPVTLLLATLLSALAISLGVLFGPHTLAFYVGWSGITHGLFAWGGVRLWQAGNHSYALLVIATVLAKLIWEASQGPTPGASEVIGGEIFVESHLYGVIGGVIAAFAKPMARMVTIFVLAAFLAFPATYAQAHSLEDSVAKLQVDPSGDVVLSLDFEIAAFVLREPPGDLSPDARARVIEMSETDLQDYVNGAGDFLLQNVVLFGTSGDPVRADRIRMPSPAALRRHAERPADPSTIPPPLLLIFDGAAVLALDAPRLQLPRAIGPLFLVVRRADGSEGIDLLPPGIPSEPLDLTTAESATSLISKSIVDGFLHVVPSGWDHALFMAILVLATPAITTCLLHATVFTVAHSITLILAGLGMVSFPTSLVEIGIALTVALAGIDTALRLRRSQGGMDLAPQPRSRLAVIFAFGLLHGLGFASVFSDLPVERASLVLSLFGFNIGVELGQIAVILAVFGLLFAIRTFGSEPAAARTRLILSVAVAAIGCLWVAKRVAGLFA